MKNSSTAGRYAAPAMAVALAAALLAGVPALAQEHDLLMLSLSADPTPVERGCSATLSANFLINGFDDEGLSSGDVEIVFYRADGASPPPAGTAGWTEIDRLPVTWTAADGPFAPGRQWPSSFPSVAASPGQSWTVPSSGDSFHVKAVVVYKDPGISDLTPGNNERVITVSAIAGSCASQSCCTPTAGRLFLCHISCLDRGILIPREKLLCMIRPELCELPPLDLCDVIPCGDPCLAGLSCPPDPWEVLVRWPPEIMQVELFAGDELVARSELLERPIERGGEIFRQVIRFTPKRGLAYTIRNLAGPKAEPGEVYPLAMEARPIEYGKRAN